MKTNHSICCDVNNCRHNLDGCNCSLDRIKVSTDSSSCTCCESFEN